MGQREAVSHSGAIEVTGAYPPPPPLCTGHCSQHLDGGEGVICLTRSQVSLGWRERVAQGSYGRSPGKPLLQARSSLAQWMEVATFS